MSNPTNAEQMAAPETAAATTTSKHVKISFGTNESDNQSAVWLVISGDKSTSSSQSQSRIVKGSLFSSNNSSNIIINPDLHNAAACVKISGGLEELRDALIQHLPPTVNTSPQQQHIKNNNPLTPEKNYYPTTLDEVKRFELFRQVIEHEDNLLNQRVSWIILAQSFLMAAFITSSENNALRYVTATVGLATVIVTLPAIIAAGRNIEVQQSVYFNGLESDAQCQALHGHSRDVSKQPNATETTERASQGHIFPNTAFRGKHSLPILPTVLGLCFVQFAGWCLLLVAQVMDW